MDSDSTATSRNAPRLLGARCSDDLPHQIELAHLRSLEYLSAKKGYTLVEVIIVMGLLTLLMATAASSIATGRNISRRLSDFTAATTVVQAKLQDIRAATYNPPNSPFTSAVVVLTGTSSIALDQAGAKFIVPGTITSRIEPVTAGHLVTVTGTFQTRRQPITVSLQTVVNKYSGGQQ